MSIVYRSVKGSKLTSNEVDGNFQYLENLVGGQGNSIIAQNGFTLISQDLTIAADWVWQILNISYTNPAAVVINIPFASSGNQRIDLIVANQSNTFERIAGVESASNPSAPAVPLNKIFVTFITVTDGVIDSPVPPITGTQFKKKDESRKFSIALTGADQEIELRAAGHSTYSVTGTGLTSVAGFSTALITASPSADPLYPGKDILFYNDTDADVTLKNAFSPVDIAFDFGADLVVPIGGKVWMKYYTTGLELVMKSWGDGVSDLEDNMHKEWCSVQARYDANGVFTLNTQALTASGTQSVVARTGASIYASLALQNYVTSTATGQNAGLKNNNSSDAVIRQGFDAFFMFANNSTDNQHMTTVGSYSLVSAIPNLPISSFTGDFFGVGNDVSDTNLSFYAHRVTASGQTASYVKVDCGADFPAHTTTDAYLLRLEAPKTEVETDRFIKMTITNIVTGISFTHTFPYTETPVLGRNFIAVINRNNRNSGTATNIRFGKYNLVKKSY